MKDPVEIQRRIERLVKRVRRRDDYGKLLARGDVVRSVDDIDDPETWRAEIKRQARADRIKVRTGQSEKMVWAVTHGPIPEAQQVENNRYFRLLELIKSRADLRGHKLKVALRDGEEVIVECERCEAIGYGDAAGETLVGGSVFDDDCPDPRPPDALSVGWL